MIVALWRSPGSCSGLQRATALVWHNVGDNGAVFDGLLSTPLLGGGGGVVCVVCVCLCGGVCFGALCTNASPS